MFVFFDDDDEPPRRKLTFWDEIESIILGSVLTALILYLCYLVGTDRISLF